MPSNKARRNFLKRLGLLGAWSSFPGATLFSQSDIASSSQTASAPSSSGNHLREANWQLIKADFPISSQKQYFNTGGFGPSPFPVIEACIAQLNDDEFRAPGNKYAKAKSKLATFVHSDVNRLALTSNTTEGINIIAQGLKLDKHAEIILTEHEHAGGALPWINRARQDKLNIRSFVPAKTAEENLDRFKALLNKKTRVAALPHITTTTGLILPLKEIQEICKQRNIWLCVDGAHGLGCLDLDLNQLKVDSYSSCAHKWLCGPAGIGFLFASEELEDQIDYTFIGAKSAADWSIKASQESMTLNAFTDIPFYGTRNHALEVGFSAAIEYFDQIGMQRVYQRISHLKDILQKELIDRKYIRYLSSTESRSQAPMISIKHELHDHLELYQLASKRKIRLRSLPEAGLNAIRISLHLMNDENDIVDLINFLDDIS